ncbi:L-iditol 2-dehydrogenase [Lacihabitans sp. CCS-44]|uniref:zinc-dependent alcohol dehydrogenase n=1 Tax=Lacihabitans sp. CCS-44 TaxID=2487331 RepID=UPI0020CD4026|nr:alcohol dehydrogenase catalytic domain-containing protein [Lacihabitans sp. CCS-44]MCP9755465.1 L-iditol 2-dehydrogenase [Lacihabitans sp. CCS-44]
MKAALLKKPKEIEIKEFDIPEPALGEVRVRLTKVGICGSDVHLFMGHRKIDSPTIIGHEGLGYIDKIGEGVEGRILGERVAIEPNIPCRKCRQCQSGRGNICVNKRVIGLNESGCFAEYICLPQEFCWFIPNSISDNDAVTIEPMAVAYHSLFSSKAIPGDTIAVLGLGAIGLLLAHLALKLGYKVFVNELNAEKLKIAVESGAIAVVSTGTLEQQTAEVAKIWLENDVIAIFECAGSPFTATLATGAAPRGSEIVLVGLSEKDASFKPLKIAREEISIVPSIIYDHPFDFKRVIQLIETKVINPGFIVSKNTSLDKIEEGLNLAAEGNHSKIIVNIQ